MVFLKSLLIESDARANLFVRDAAPLLRAALGDRSGDRFVDLARDIEAFDYDAALSKLPAASKTA